MATETDGPSTEVDETSGEAAEPPAETDGTSGETVEEADEDGLESYLRSVTVTTLSTLLGIVAGLLAAVVASGPQDLTGVLILGALIAVQFPVLNVLGIDTGDFGTKDQLYVIFMTFALWFVSWGLLMTLGVSF